MKNSPNELISLLNDLPPDEVWRPVRAADGTLLARGRGALPDVVPETLDSIGFTNRTVLDLGCNLGAYSIEAVRRGAAHVTGVDISPKVIRAAGLVAELHGLKDKIDYVVGDFLKSELKIQAQVGLLVDFIGRGVVRKGRVDACLRALTRSGCTDMLLTLHPVYSLDVLNADAKNLTDLYGKTYVGGGEFRLLDYVHGKLGAQWRVETAPNKRSLELGLKMPVVCKKK